MSTSFLVLAVLVPCLQVLLVTITFVWSFKRSYLRGCASFGYKPPTNKELTRMAVSELWGERIATISYGKEKKQ